MSSNDTLHFQGAAALGAVIGTKIYYARKAAEPSYNKTTNGSDTIHFSGPNHSKLAL
jgi:hypothetical protein